MNPVLNININYLVAILITVFSVNLAWSTPLYLDLNQSVLKDLPQEMTKDLPRDLKLKLKRLNQTQINFCQNKIPVGSTYAAYSKRTKTIYLSQSLENALTTCPQKASQLVKEKLAHEYFHAYDKNKKIQKEKIKKCRGRYETSESAKPICRELIEHNNREFFISDDIRFLNLAQIHGRTRKTFKGKRTLNPYELKDRYEFSATNFEAFLYDKEYKCRRPSLYSYFKDKFNHDPSSQTNCEEKNFIYTESNQIIDISPEKIYQIHYMYADVGDEPMSWFGHSMLRFVTCAPERLDPLTGNTIPATPMGEECLKDTKYHFVVTFRAMISNGQVNNLDGIKGKYPSKLYINKVKKVLHDYNAMEFRDIYSYPLILNPKQKVKLINKVRETFWEYAGTYKFFTNNCATETYKMIAGALGDLQTNLYEPLTPAGTLHRLRTNKLLKPKGSNVKKYKSREDILNQSSLIIYKLTGIDLKIDQYRSLSALERRELFNNAIKISLHKKQTISAFKVFENHTLKKKRSEYAQAFAFAYSTKVQEDEDFVTRVKKNAFLPHEYIKSSYGIPSQEELDQIEAYKEELDLKTFQKFLNNEFKDDLSPELNEIAQTIMNIKFLIKQRNL